MHVAAGAQLERKPYLQELIQHFRQEGSFRLLSSRGVGRVCLHSLGFTLGQAPPCLVKLLVGMQLQLHSKIRVSVVMLLTWQAKKGGGGWGEEWGGPGKWGGGRTGKCGE